MSLRTLFSLEKTATSHLRGATSLREVRPCTLSAVKSRVISSARSVITRDASWRESVDTPGLAWTVFKTSRYSLEIQQLILGKDPDKALELDLKSVLREAALRILLGKRTRPWRWISSLKLVHRLLKNTQWSRAVLRRLEDLNKLQKRRKR